MTPVKIPAALICGLLVCSLSTSAKAQLPVETRASLLNELIPLIGEHGWMANVGRLCALFKGPTNDKCVVKQIAIDRGTAGSIDNHGFNVPLNDLPDSAIILFHLRPLVGNFFLVAPNGELKAALYRSRGMDFAELHLASAREAFDVSMAFWRDNLTTLKKSITAGDLKKR